MSHNRVIVILCVILLLAGLPEQALVGSLHAIPTSSFAGPAKADEVSSMLQFISGGHALGFTPQSMYAATGSHALRVDFVDANNVQPQAESSASPSTLPQAQESASLKAGSQSRAAPLGRVAYANLWDGVSLTYSAGAGSIYATTYTLASGADAKNIHLRYNAPLSLNQNGTLNIAFKTGTLTESAPIAWQDINSQRAFVDVSFQVRGQDVSFVLGAYDPHHALTIDPSLVWNTFLGGGGADTSGDIAVDTSGNIYVSGASTVAWGSPVRAYTSGRDAYAAKLASSGTLIWNTFLGGSGEDYGSDIAVDNNGDIYVTGASTATWGSPVRAYTGGTDAFAAKLNSSGAPTWNTFLGGSGEDYGAGIAVDNNGIYTSGASATTWGSSPVRAYTGGADAFVAKLDTSSGALTWNTFLGDIGDDYGTGIAVDNNGIYTSGASATTWGSPVRVYTSGADAFAARLDSSGVLTWNTFLGGDGTDYGYGIAVDNNGNVYVTGYSTETWGSPVRAYTGADAFAARLDSSGALIWNTFLGGDGDDSNAGIAVNNNGNIYVTGASNATWGNPQRAYTSGHRDAYTARLDSSGALIWNTFLGGTGDDTSGGIAVDSNENAYVTGASNSTWGNPQRAYNNSTDAFAAKLDNIYHINMPLIIR